MRRAWSMGAPMELVRNAQATAGGGHLKATMKALEEFEFEHQRNGTRVVRERIGVVGLITPWNWPLNQIVDRFPPGALACWSAIRPTS
jgi:aldehyde dehydrogenase (NAD+)